MVRQSTDTPMSLEIRKAGHLGGISLTEMAKQMSPISVVQWTPYCLSMYVLWKDLFEHEHAVIPTSVYSYSCFCYDFQISYCTACSVSTNLHGLESHSSFTE